MVDKLTEYAPLLLIQDLMLMGSGRNSIYHVLTGVPKLQDYVITEEKKAEFGFVQVGHALPAGAPGWAIYHHLPSQTTIKVCSGFRKPYVEIFGVERERAKKDLISLLAPRDFQLRPPTAEELTFNNRT